MKTKNLSCYILSFIFITLLCSAFAEPDGSSNISSAKDIPVTANNTKLKEISPQGTPTNNSDQQGTSGVAEATAQPVTLQSVASANIITQNTTNKTVNNKLTNSKSSIKPAKKSAADFAGAKEILFTDNEQIKIILSSRDINKVFVTGDKIKAIHGPTGLYAAKNDPSDPYGSIYISIYSNTFFTIFLTTLKGHNCSLLIVPKTTPGRTIILNPTTSILPSLAEDSYQKTLIDLISNMINLEPSEDYAYFSISEAKKYKWIDLKKTSFYNVADIIPVAFYHGENLSGIISKVRNKTRNPLTLKPSYFYQSGIKAATLSEQIVPPLGACWLYQIVGLDQ